MFSLILQTAHVEVTRTKTFSHRHKLVGSHSKAENISKVAGQLDDEHGRVEQQ